jgi:probable rRNA maturation factor
MPVELQVADAAPDADRLPAPTLFERWAEAALLQVNRAEAIAEQTICIRVTGNDESQALNREYRQQDKPTNVLSFPAELPEALALVSADEPLPLGDLVLSLPVVMAEAAAQGKSLHNHLAHLVMHGTLHLLGYDHESDDDAELMESIEIAALAECGIDNPYSSEAGAPS